MACCAECEVCDVCGGGGSSQIIQLTVPGIDGTDGPPIDVSMLGARKTVQLSGSYEGQYILLGSHDGDHYVPLLTFNSGDGPQSFRKTTPYTLRFMKIRRRAFVSESVTVHVGASFQCECVTGCSSGGASQIVELPLPGIDQTDGASVDVSDLGPSKSIQISGDYEGQYIILGSHDDVHYAPLLTFNSGVGEQSFKRTMQFSVRYLKVRRRAFASNVTAIFVAAPYQCTCSGGNNSSGTGATQIFSLDVPGQDNTDGIALDVGDMASRKSIQISGIYQGQLIVLGSHDGVHYVPLLTFNSGAGIQSFRQTMCVPLRFLKLRRRAAVFLSPVSAFIGAPFQCACNAGQGGGDDSAENLSIIAYLNATLASVPQSTTVTPGDEFIIGAPSTPFGATTLVGPSYIPVPWNFPGSQIRVGIKGSFTIAGNPVTITMYVGGNPTTGDRIPEGTLVHSFVIPVGADQLIEEISPLFTQPATSPSYFEIAARNDFGTDLVVAATNDAYTPFVQLESGQTDLYMAVNTQGVVAVPGVGPSAETIQGNYFLDLDSINSANIEIRFVGRIFQNAGVTAIYRLRLGGTVDTLDGSIIASLTTTTGTNPDGAFFTITATVANPGGVTILKLTGERTGGLFGLGPQFTEHSFTIRGL